ncbi:MAG: hypothetical protein ABID64_01290 [Nitrospirota bacterium]
MISCKSETPITFGAETEQPQELPSKRISGISGIAAGLVGATLALSGCAQLKPRPAHCRCDVSPSKKSKEKFLEIALRLHKIHTEGMELIRELDLFEKAGDETKEAREESQKRKPEIKGKLMKLLLELKKYKEMVLKNSVLNSRIISVEDYLKRSLKDHFEN